MKNHYRLLLVSFLSSILPLSAADALPAATSLPEATSQPEAAALQVTLESLLFVSPSGWVDVPVASAMRKATWRTGTGDDAAEIAFFAFGKDQGGSVSDNIQRWLDQFSESKTKGESATVQINERAVTFVRSEGVFASGMPGGPVISHPGFALFGVIIEMPEGNVFIKVTGPMATVKKLEATFAEIVTKAAKS